ncbi:flavin reductase family protein, partial [Staphylococcus aureus]
MYTFDAQSLTARENYKLLIGSIIPRPIAFVTTLNQDASVNAAPFSFFNIVNNHPPM